jgi:hypothetical protein
MLREFGGPLGGQALKKQSRLETEIERARLENGCKGAVQAEEAAGIVDRKRDAKAEEKEAEQKSSSPLKELVH